MRITLFKSFVLALLALAGAPALADPPARVGRISSTEGTVLVRGDGADDSDMAMLNWPITSNSRITTSGNGRAEFRVGSSAVRLDLDSELEVNQLDDEHFSLRLNYGSVGVRIKNPDLLRGFELRTEQARVVFEQPGWLRVDGRSGASAVSVLAGVARVEGGGASLPARAGQRVEISDEEVSSGQLRRDAFDDWADTPVAAPQALRYVSEDITGYEELDRYGSWRDDAEYGALWSPRGVPADWVPYRDGRWTWIDPWGWTWVDNAPWAYAPSHYGRWVLLERRWCWAPGPARARPAWAPALVGWVGGAQWQAGLAPALGWFPLPPRERYVPTYRVSPDYERRVNPQFGGRWSRQNHVPGNAEKYQNPHIS
ncbi:hypothetical protein AAKU55_000534 [Oxalobacteraceae bacterium GrIS 1.11]